LLGHFSSPFSSPQLDRQSLKPNDCRSSILMVHDLIGKPVSTFSDNARFH
jgi:hypothetical protein